jgi:glycogen debranching enzyme
VESGTDTAPLGVLVPQPTVTLVEGSSFCVADYNGEIQHDRSDGLFVRDTRILSRWRLLVDAEPLEPMTVIPHQPFDCVFVGRAPTRENRPDATIVVERHRYVGGGMREDIVVRNYGNEPSGLDLTLEVDADFVDLFQVKEQRFRPRRPVAYRAAGDDLLFWTEQTTDQRGVRITGAGGHAVERSLVFRIVVPVKGEWRTTVEVLPSVNGQELAREFPTDRPLEQAAPARRMRGWNEAAPRIRVGNPALREALSWSRRDLGALRIVDPDHPEDEVVAAGAPWFMALFGRDSLLTSWMMLPYFPDLALGTLRTLARMQGRHDNPRTEEQPGRILHEVRLGAEPALALGGESVYYGSIDSTPLFVALIGQALRWGVPKDRLAELRPAVDRAMAWISEYGDRDGDGFVEYERRTDRGLPHQGWKDSTEPISFHDGSPGRPPIALAEVQGYCYAAFLAKADLDEAFGDTAGAEYWRRRAADLKRRFHAAFWIEELGFYAVALDRSKRPVDSITSNIGHCLWAGIVDEEVADRVVARLLSGPMFTGFGIRTLSADSGAYNPISYHNCSVWPHDTVLGAAGMARYGFQSESERVLAGLLDTARAFGGRLPELFCGFDRADKPVPVPYPASCSPQAWAAAVPFQILTTGLGLDPGASREMLSAADGMPLLGEVAVDGLGMGPAELRVRSDGRKVDLLGLPPAVAISDARPHNE